jgi:protein TonB
MKRHFVLIVAAVMATSVTAFAQKETTQTTTTQSAPADPVFKYVEQMPEPGYDVYAYVKDNIRYPAGHDTTGGVRVVVEFVVNIDGSLDLEDAHVMRSFAIPKAYQEESVRLLRAMPKWKPGKQNGRPVRVYYTLPILFSKDGK